MIMDFDREIAKEAIELGEGRIITREGDQVMILDWGFDDRSGFPVTGDLRLPNGNTLSYQTWTSKGKFLFEGDSDFDLIIELRDEFLNGTDS